MTQVFGFKPWDVDRLTPPDFLAYCAAIDKLERETDGGGS